MLATWQVWKGHPPKAQLFRVRTGQGLPLWQKLHDRIFQLVFQHIIAKDLQILQFAIHNIKRFRESGEISAHKAEKPTVNACDFQSFRWQCIKTPHDCINDIIAWAGEHYGETIVRKHSLHLQMQCQATFWMPKRVWILDCLQSHRKCVAHYEVQDMAVLTSECWATEVVCQLRMGKNFTFKTSASNPTQLLSVVKRNHYVIQW